MRLTDRLDALISNVEMRTAHLNLIGSNEDHFYGSRTWAAGVILELLRESAGLDLKSVRLHATIQTQTIHMPLSCSQRHAGQLTTN